MQRQFFIAPVIILVAVVALYGGFLYSPIVFDDTYFFLPGAPERFLSHMGLYPRTLAYVTIALTWKWLGAGLLAFRIQSLLLHAATAISLYLFLLQVQTTLTKDTHKPSLLLPLLATLIFALHPVAVYGAAYLIERTIVMATLFALLSWICFLRGLESGQRWLWWSVVFYALSAMSKEHAVMVPAVSAALGLWWWRTQSDNRPTMSQLLLRVRWQFAVSGVIAALLVFVSLGLLGTPYELDAANMLVAQVPEHAWPLSMMTQGFLFFKYLALWLLPNPSWMSVDMREPFAYEFLAWPQTFGFLLFLLWPVCSIWLLWKGGRRGLFGFAMLAPWLLFATELATVRFQESFVLYRSYLWIAPSLSVVLLARPMLSEKLLKILVVCVPLLLFPLAYNRLVTFSHPLLLWDDAANLVEAKGNVASLTGLERIYRNRGVELFKTKQYELAIKDYTTALNFRPDFYYAYNDRGAALLALKQYPEALAEFDAALKLKSDHPNSGMGRAKALEALGRTDDANQEYQRACTLGWRPACSLLRQ